MDYKAGGELFQYLQREGGRFSEDRVRFYASEITLALDYLHKRNIIYRCGHRGMYTLYDVLDNSGEQGLEARKHLARRHRAHLPLRLWFGKDRPR
jgi:hypothetical protein